MLKVKEKVTSFWQNHDLEKFHPYNKGGNLLLNQNTPPGVTIGAYLHLQSFSLTTKRTQCGPS